MLNLAVPIPVVARSKVQVCGSSHAETAGSNPAGDMDVCLFVNIVCYQAEVSKTGRSLVQRSPTVCVCVRASERERERALET